MSRSRRHDDIIELPSLSDRRKFFDNNDVITFTKKRVFVCDKCSAIFHYNDTDYDEDQMRRHAQYHWDEGFK